MRIQVTAPHHCEQELDYVLNVVLADFLGLTWCRVLGEQPEFRLSVEDREGKLRLPSVFFPLSEEYWLKTPSLPASPSHVCDSRILAVPVTLVSERIPVIFGDVNPEITHIGEEIRLPIDIFGSIFFMLSRYEEAVGLERDGHDRFPSTASLAHKAGFLDRPIVDEYVELLWSAMKKLWPNLERRPRQPRTLVSCDVDHPYVCISRSFLGTMKAMGGDLLKRRSLATSMQRMSRHLEARHGNYSQDPYMNAIDWIMDVNEQANNKVAFYFIAGHVHPIFDSCYDVGESVVRDLLRRIDSRGHEIGLHASYTSYKNYQQTCREVDRLREAMNKEGIEQSVMGGRQHFLRWDILTTARNLESAGMAYDTTLSFADRAGFRCGTCHEYQMYDLAQRRPMHLIQRPLVLMECSVIDATYMGMGYTEEAIEYMKALKQRCYQFGGNFTLLWHNSRLNHKGDKSFYYELVGDR